MLRGVKIGQFVTFQDKHQATRQGRVVGVETVGAGDRLGRSPGRWLLVKCSDEGYHLQVREDAAGGVLAGAAA